MSGKGTQNIVKINLALNKLKEKSDIILIEEPENHLSYSNMNLLIDDISKYKDGKVVEKDLKLIESLLLDLKLTPGVVNVLIDYVLKVNNQKLNKNYVEAIASQWKRLGIETVEEAMNACKKEHKKLVKEKANIPSKKLDKVPEWFDKQIEKQEITEEEKKQLEEILKEYN